MDIQQLGLVGDKKISVVTYEDRKLQFGKDKVFNFELTEGTVPPSLWSSLQARLTKPLVSAVIPELPEAKYQLHVKHQHGLGLPGHAGARGGVCRIKSDSRFWRYEDLSSVGSTGPFQLRLSSSSWKERTTNMVQRRASSLTYCKAPA